MPGTMPMEENQVSRTTLELDLGRIGLRLQENLIPSDIRQRCFEGRRDCYRASQRTHFALAVTK